MTKDQAMTIFIRNFAELIINRLPMEELRECRRTNNMLIAFGFLDTDGKLIGEWDEFNATDRALRKAEWLYEERTQWNNDIDEESTDFFDEFMLFCELDDELSAMGN